MSADEAYPGAGPSCPDCGHGRAIHQSSGCVWCACTTPRARLLADGIRQGEQLRDEGIELVLTSDRSAEWRDAARAWVEQRPQGARFTATELVDEIGSPPSPQAVGAVFRAKALDGAISHTGVYLKSARPSRHAGMVVVWERL